MKQAEIKGRVREATTQELGQMLAQAREELFRLRFQMASKRLPNPMRLREVRRHIARILTALRQRELSGG